MEVLQTSPLATWVRRRTDRITYWRATRVSTRRTAASARNRASARCAGGRLARGGRLGRLPALLLPLLERLHRRLGFTPFAHVAFEGTAACHEITSRAELPASLPLAPSKRA